MALPGGAGVGVVALHGHCLDLLPSIPDGSVDMVFADLPYGVTANKWDSVIPFEPLWAELLRVGKRNAAFVFTATFPFARTLLNSQPDIFRYDIQWQKGRATGVLNSKRQPLRIHEGIWVFYRAQPTYHPQMWDAGKPRHSSGKRADAHQSSNYHGPMAVGRTANDRYPQSIITITDREHGLHPTQKPVALLEWLVKTYTHTGDTVLDPTMGSGTTGCACIATDRKFIGIEKDASYFATAQQRLEEAQNASQARFRLDGHRCEGSGEGSTHRRGGGAHQLTLAPCNGPAVALGLP